MMHLPIEIPVEIDEETLDEIEREIESGRVPERDVGEWIEAAIEQRLRREGRR